MSRPIHLCWCLISVFSDACVLDFGLHLENREGSTQMSWPLLVYSVFVVALVGVVLVVSYLLGPRHSEAATGEPYEGGIVSQGSAHVRFSMRYYMVALFFVVFDLEAAFIYAWAVTAREVGWLGYWGFVLFVATLAATLVYLWRVGALDWARRTGSSR
jgi:NADH-quinone oxidoreductase subunit A